MRTNVIFFLAFLATLDLFSVASAAQCPQVYPDLLRPCMAGSGTLSESRRAECDILKGSGCGCPDLRPYVPQQIQITNSQGRNLLRFTAGSANLPTDGLLAGSAFEIGACDVSQAI
tara:strand:- start:1576 stop:1923 length:348 start_codon:yes stop_codon:yes gene_type:complete